MGDMLMAAMQEDIDDESALQLSDDIAQRVALHGSRSVLLDISAAQFVDSFICRVVVDIAAICGLLGAKVAVVGMRPAVAITLVELGLTLDGVTTALTVDDAVTALSRPTSGAGLLEHRQGNAGRAPGGRQRS
jgi:rsbT antagonist protein RsbS